MLERVISGGQTGADQAGWRAAKRCGLPTGGWMPAGWLTEDGPRPDFEGLYGAWEHASPSYVVRTRENVYWCDALIWFGNPWSRGGRATMRSVEGFGKDHYVVVNPGYHGDRDSPPFHEWIVNYTTSPEVRTLMVAGNRESSAPGIGAWVEDYLVEVFALLGHAPATEAPHAPSP